MFDTDKEILIGYAASGDRFKDWLTNPQPDANPALRDMAGGFCIAGQAAGPGASRAVHTGSDIPLSTGGPRAGQFTGVMDNTDVLFKVIMATGK